MDAKYVYVKTRSQFGKQCFFADSEIAEEENILPDEDMMKDYFFKNPIDVQVSKQFALHEVQTENIITKESGMNHTEGGWPKEINPKDEEAVTRYRRRVEKDDSWAPKVLELMQRMDHYILQNNSVNIHENYFDDLIPTELVLPLSTRTINMYNYPESNYEPITHLAWSNHGERLAASYCTIDFEKLFTDYNTPSYIWDIENPNKPFMALKANHPSVTIEFNPRDPSMLISGLMSGEVCNWDIRTGNKPIQMSHPQFSHKSPASNTLWINSKTNSEFFSASSDGIINWWDTRMLVKPIEYLVMDLEDPMRGDEVKAVGISSLDFDSAIGTKFMAGLENGVVISGTRKGKTPVEKLAMKFDCHDGPVMAIDRNPFTTKYFLTIDDWSAKIWAEDTREGSLLSNTKHKYMLTGGCWSTSRYSVFYLINDGGMIEVFDILVGFKDPVIMTRICEDCLKAIAPHEDGKLVAVGSDRGKIYLVESSEALTTNTSNDRNAMAEYLERCSRFEKAVDNRLKETRHAQRISYSEPESPLASPRGKVKSRVSSSSSRKPNREKVSDDRKKVEKEKRRSKLKKGKYMWERLADPGLADVEKKYFEDLQNEMEKYANALAIREEKTKEIASTLSVREMSPKRENQDDSKIDKDIGRMGSASHKSRSVKKQSGKNKGEKVTKSKEIVIIKRTDDSMPEKTDDDRTTDKTQPELNTIDELHSESDDDDDMEKWIEQERKHKFEILLKKLRIYEDDEICDPDLIALLGDEKSDGNNEEDGDETLEELKDLKINDLIETNSSTNILSGHLKDIPTYTKEEKMLIFKKNFQPPLLLKNKLKTLNDDDLNDIVDLKHLENLPIIQENIGISDDINSSPPPPPQILLNEESELTISTTNLNVSEEISKKPIKVDNYEPISIDLDSKEIPDVKVDPLKSLDSSDENKLKVETKKNFPTVEITQSVQD